MNAPADGGLSGSATSSPFALKEPFIDDFTRAVGGMKDAHFTDFGSTFSSTVIPFASSERM